jgi:hypothetical protein
MAASASRGKSAAKQTQVRERLCLYQGDPCDIGIYILLSQSIPRNGHQTLSYSYKGRSYYLKVRSKKKINHPSGRFLPITYIITLLLNKAKSILDPSIGLKNC